MRQEPNKRPLSQTIQPAPDGLLSYAIQIIYLKRSISYCSFLTFAIKSVVDWDICTTHGAKERR